ncbi:MAG: flagellar type III secretion system pore protein FliP [Candidatus Saganbacteria bacterium]|nr:flagellar type III secretion system pore protein FliP [Candidatus Saganbacteria bacterium]
MAVIFTVIFFILMNVQGVALAADPLRAGVNISAIMNSPQFSSSVQLIVGIALLSIVPFILVSMTSFLRIIIVFSFARTAIGTQSIPPNSVIVGLALFMTVFVMAPVWQEVNTSAIEPYNKGRLTQMKAIEIGSKPLQRFMLRQTREKDLALFLEFSKIAPPKKVEDIPIYIVIPSFMISELKTAFQIGFLLFVPFVMIDLVVANILLSLGMFMLSPVMVSLPFKILLFVLADGWALITRGLLTSFR